MSTPHREPTEKRNISSGNPTSGLRPGHFLSLAGLLILPGFAADRQLGSYALPYAGGWVLLMSVVTYVVYAVDKNRARNQAWREPETHLHVLELLGGWPGAFLAQRHLRHKSAKRSYQFLAIDALRGWAFVQQVVVLLKKI